MRLCFIILTIALAFLVGCSTEEKKPRKADASAKSSKNAQKAKQPEVAPEETQSQDAAASHGAKEKEDDIEDDPEEEEDQRPAVDSPAGTFEGIHLTSMNGHLFEGFLGIPYAQPPIGKLRFAKPQPYPKIEDIQFDASTVAPTCIQPKDFNLGYQMNEDCLYLNVYTPVFKDEENPKLNKVLVYIHGGAYFVGTANEYVPGDLVALGNIIVVTMNYRLSWLGFLKGDTLQLPGNQGLWDQVMALQWVKDNIKSFGGDPDDVTITSNLMGGESVSALTLSPYGKGLFTKAILTSGSLYGTPSINGSSDFLLDKLSDLVGCNGMDIDPKDADAKVKCLRDLPSEAFVLPADLSLRQAFVTIDGDFFPNPIPEIMQNKYYLGGVGFFSRDYLISMTNNEGMVFYHSVFGSTVHPDDVDSEFLASITGLPIPLCEKIFAWYKEPGHSSTKPAYDIPGDVLMIIPQIQFIGTFGSITKAQPPNRLGKQYVMYLNFTPEFIPEPLQGIGHGIDLVYLFDLVPTYVFGVYYNIPTEKELSPEDLAFRKRYMRIVTDFMKTGNPGTTLAYDAKIKWKSFNSEFEDYLSLEPEPVIRHAPLIERRRFWGGEFIMEAVLFAQANVSLLLPIKDEL